MKTYIVTITKAFDKREKIQVEANSIREILALSETQFGLGIAPLKRSDIVLKSNLPNDQQGFHYRLLDIHEKWFVF